MAEDKQGKNSYFLNTIFKSHFCKHSIIVLHVKCVLTAGDGFWSRRPTLGGMHVCLRRIYLPVCAHVPQLNAVCHGGCEEQVVGRRRVTDIGRALWAGQKRHKQKRSQCHFFSICPVGISNVGTAGRLRTAYFFEGECSGGETGF